MHTSESALAAQLAESHELADRLADPSDVLYKDFYGDGGITPTHLYRAPHHLYGHGLLIKDETSHAASDAEGSPVEVAAFKRRGALAETLRAVTENPEIKTLVTASAGNHGLGVVAAANQLSLKAVVYGRSDMSPVKRDRISAMGGIVVAESMDLAEALISAQSHALRKTLGKVDTAFIHPFSNPGVIAGQATIGLEMLADLQTQQALGRLDLHQDQVTIVLPEGGGGLAAGVGIVFKQARDRMLVGANLQVLTAQPQNKADHQWCDGTTTSTSPLTESVLSDNRYIQGRLVVSDEMLADAMFEATQYVHRAVEPAGALALAGARLVAAEHSVRSGATHTFVVPVTGANVSQETLDHTRQLRHERYQRMLGSAGTSRQTSVTSTKNGRLTKNRQKVSGGLIGS